MLPGFADAHSHAFHRALRGRTHDGGGTFWTWRERMYAVAARLDPDSYLALARAAYAEMALAGVTAVGEFHYLHHGPDGRPYDDPNAMGHALAQAAADAGIRLTLLDTCYLAADVDGRPVEGVQRRFSDGAADAWAERVAALRDAAGAADRRGRRTRCGRCRGRQLPVVVDDGRRVGRPLHVHLSEQPAENAACLAAHGLTPTGLLAAEGLLGPATTAVHATHLTADDIALLGGSGTTACLCPTTEADLADGLGPARALRDAGCPLALGGDQHAVTDPFAEARGLEMHERLASGERGRFTPADLLDALTAHSALGWPDAGRLALGARADLVAVRLDTPRTAGATRPRWCSPRAPPTSTPWWWTATSSSAAAGTCSATSARCCRRRSNRCGRTRERPSARLESPRARHDAPGPARGSVSSPGSASSPPTIRTSARCATPPSSPRASTIAWVGPAARAPAADRRIDVGGRAVVPGFVDSHTHLVFAGDRAAEFAARMRGERYDGGRHRLDRRRHPGRRRRRVARAARPPGSPSCAPRAPRPSRSRAATASPSPTRSARCAWPPR